MGRTQWNLSRAARFPRLGKSQLCLCFEIYQYYQNWICLINNQELGGEQEQLHASSAVGHERERGLYGQGNLPYIPAKHVIKCLAKLITVPFIVVKFWKKPTLYNGKDLPTMGDMGLILS